MTCRDFITFLLDYIDGGLPDTERARFDEHLRLCVACRHYLQAYQETVKLGRLALTDLDPDQAVPADVPDELVDAILSARRPNS
jgi:anti-sigma factor RsiW